MLLPVQERIALLGLLPVEGNFVTLKIVRELREELSFSDTELKEYSVKQADGRITWNTEAAKDKELTIGDTMKGIIVTALKKLDADGQLVVGQLALFEKFVE